MLHQLLRRSARGRDRARARWRRRRRAARGRASARADACRFRPWSLVLELHARGWGPTARGRGPARIIGKRICSSLAEVLEHLGVQVVEVRREAARQRAACRRARVSTFGRDGARAPAARRAGGRDSAARCGRSARRAGPVVPAGEVSAAVRRSPSSSSRIASASRPASAQASSSGAAAAAAEVEADGGRRRAVAPGRWIGEVGERDGRRVVHGVILLVATCIRTLRATC